jgi:hypothetical protein
MSADKVQSATGVFGVLSGCEMAFQVGEVYDNESGEALVSWGIENYLVAPSTGCPVCGTLSGSHVRGCPECTDGRDRG